MKATRNPVAAAGNKQKQQDASDAAGFSGQERRRYPRQSHEVAATLQPAGGEADLDQSVQVRDLSLGGVGLICEFLLAQDSVWRITLGNGPLLLNAKVRVVACRPRSDGRFDVGCEFC
jgi:hypothetical protein